MSVERDNENIELSSYIFHKVCKGKRGRCLKKISCTTCLRRFGKKDILAKLYHSFKYTGDKLTAKELFIGRLKYPSLTKLNLEGVICAEIVSFSSLAGVKK